MAKRNSHCSYCGAAFAPDLAWPRTCTACSNISYVNPIPVAVLVLPVDDGVLAIRRGVPPMVGKLALPGGYVNYGESWEQGAARELFEETGIVTDPARITHLRTVSTQDGTVLIFGLAERTTASALPVFTATDETTERPVLLAPEDLAFSLHTEVLRDHFARKLPQGRTAAQLRDGQLTSQASWRRVGASR